ncbi:MAG: SDR family oxidoreductase [Mesorhizobium sp.]|nr:MAG: SDR family oxidoreductase [Mesorhizobium sp.]
MSKGAPSSADDFLTGLKGQRVLVTAGAGGIGFAIADTLSRLGARIVVCDVSDEALAAAPDRIAPHGIRVNAILPGIIEGPRIDKVIADRAKQLGVSNEAMTERYLQNISLRRMTSPYDVASMVAFLLSNAGINISGQSLGVDGNVETL